MTKTTWLIGSGALALALHHPMAAAFEADLSYGKRQGEVIYQIGGQITIDSGESGRVRFPLSELRFPVNTPIANLQLSHTFANHWRIAATLGKNTSATAGYMEDRDWGVNFWSDPESFPQDSLDIYSESRTKLDGRDLRLEIAKQVHPAYLPNWEIFVGGGLLAQDYDFEAFDVVQSYPSTPEQPVDRVKGKVITYEYQARMPFLSFSASRQLHPRTSARFSAAYSPLLQVTDRDNHILRDKTSTGDSEGWGIMLEARLSYNLTSWGELHIGANYIKTVANGLQTQRLPEGEAFSSAEIGLRNIVEQKSLYLGIRVLL